MEEEFFGEDSQNHPSSPCCFCSGVAHEDVFYPFFRDLLGVSPNECVKAPRLPLPSLFYFCSNESCALFPISKLLLRWWWCLLSTAEELFPPPHLRINIWTKINAYVGCFHLLWHLHSFNEKIISAMEEQWPGLQ